MDFIVKPIPLNSIIVAGPRAIQTEGLLEKDEQLVMDYSRLLEDFNVSDRLLLWQSGTGEFHLLSRIENYESHIRYHNHYGLPSSQAIFCDVLVGCTEVEAHEFHQRLQDLRALHPEPEVLRMIMMKNLLISDPGLSDVDLKRIYGVLGKSKSKEGKQFERDLSIVKHDAFFCGVLGLDGAEPPYKPNPLKAIYTYSFCARHLALSIGKDAEAVSQFHLSYGEYLNDIRERPHAEDMDVKPIFKWPDYSQDRVLNIASATIRDESINFGRDKEERDVEWVLVPPKSDGGFLIPLFRANCRSLAKANIKALVELAYVANIIAFAALSFIKTIAPIGHGLPVRRANRDLEPAPFDVVMNNFDLTQRYFNWVRTYKLLYYANRIRLLNSIGLRPHYFGFNRSGPFDQTTYLTACQTFNAWYKDEFLEKIVPQSEDGEEQSHPFFPTYKILKNRLAELGATEPHGGIFFKDFINILFTFVFNDFDAEEERRSAAKKNYRKLQENISQHTLQGGQIDEPAPPIQ